VGIDDIQADAEVLAWAARAARRRGDVLTIAHAGETYERCRAVLDEAAARAHAAAPGVTVRPYPAEENPAEMLLDQARSAELTVLGPGRRRLFSMGAVAERVVDHAPGPVVIVRGTDHAAVRSVAVGVDPWPDGREASLLAVEFAIEEARLNGARLDAVASYWSPEPPAPILGQVVGAEFAARRVAAGRAIEEIVAPYAEKHPEIPVTVELSAQPPGPVLEQFARRADLVVVGCRDHGPVGRFMLGSVGHGLAHHAACPVAIVRSGR